jgi:NDP-sugar pyrophosphorylase family protein
MNVVLTMAGKYQRFRLFGNRVPKYLMPLGKVTVLWHVIDELKRSSSNIQVFLLANKEDRDFFPVLTAILSDFSIDPNNLAFIDDTNSQLETAVTINNNFQGRFLNNHDPIVFGNIDTIIKSRSSFFDRLSTLEKNEGLIDSFKGSSHEYSYVKTSQDDILDLIADGSRVSEKACSGLYGFGSTDFFSSEAKEVLRERKAANFTNIYASLLEKGCSSYVQHNPDARDTIVLGTPEEYITNLHRFSL